MKVLLVVLVIILIIVFVILWDTFSCLHNWYKINTLGCRIIVWKCEKCGKIINRDIENNPISYIE